MNGLNKDVVNLIGRHAFPKIFDHQTKVLKECRFNCLFKLSKAPDTFENMFKLFKCLKRVTVKLQINENLYPLKFFYRDNIYHYNGCIYDQSLCGDHKFECVRFNDEVF